MTNRRTFISLLGAVSAAKLPIFAQSTPKFDANLSVLISDLHICGASKGSAYQREKLKRVVADILMLSPLPQRVITFGDVAYLYGRPEDYALVKQILQPLVNAGITIHHSMGNHDRRSAFLQTYPEYAQLTKVPGRIVTVVDAGAVDFIMLDGLQGSDNRGVTEKGPGTGKLDDHQQQWIANELPKRRKPFLTCSHFPVSELTLGKKRLSHFLIECPFAVGYIHGHDHRWYKTMPIKSFSSSKQIRTLCLPSTGHWGDIGYTLLRTTPTSATAALHQYEYYFPNPKARNSDNAAMWDDITAENQKQTMTFRFPKA